MMIMFKATNTYLYTFTNTSFQLHFDGSLSKMCKNRSHVQSFYCFFFSKTFSLLFLLDLNTGSDHCGQMKSFSRSSDIICIRPQLVIRHVSRTQWPQTANVSYVMDTSQGQKPFLSVHEIFIWDEVLV